LNRAHRVAFYLVLSLIGAIFLIGIILYSPVSSPIPIVPDKIVVASMFIFLCVLGISFSLRPNWLKAMKLKNNATDSNKPHDLKRCFLGHHPDCSFFDTHRIRFAKKTWCAGCFGLLIGCLVTMILMIIYVAISYQQPSALSRLLFFFGLLLIVLVYVELFLGSPSPTIHIIFNSLLIVGFFCITIGIIELSGNGIYGFFTILICILWLETRIQLSGWRHSLLCKGCTETCKMYGTSG
jgi:uncharacterized membrane protein